LNWGCWNWPALMIMLNVQMFNLLLHWECGGCCKYLTTWSNVGEWDLSNPKGKIIPYRINLCGVLWLKVFCFYSIFMCCPKTLNTSQFIFQVVKQLLIDTNVLSWNLAFGWGLFNQPALMIMLKCSICFDIGVWKMLLQFTLVKIGWIRLVKP
jgi:hypothetical protein